MTRINVGISVKLLSRQHLIAEHREIKRIPNMIKNGRLKHFNDVPKQFTLGKGHVKFFYNKLEYLRKRYIELYNECLIRGYDVQNYESAWEGIDPKLMGNYEPTIRDINIVMQRIKERTKE